MTQDRKAFMRTMPDYPRRSTLPDGSIQLRQLLDRRWVKDADGEGVRDVVEKINYPTTGAPVRERYMETHYMSHSQDGEGFTTDWVLQAVPDSWKL